MIKKVGSKVFLDGVRKVTWASGEMCEFASALVSAMLYLGESIAYDDVMGTSGAAFRFTLTPGEWEFSDYSFRKISADPHEPVRRAFHALGYSYTFRGKSSPQEDTAAILDSIDRGIPILAYPVVGPSDCCILTGYDEGGSVMLGWSTYQDIPNDHDIPHDVTGYFRKPGWHDHFSGCILPGEKGEAPSLEEVFRDSLEWALHLMRTPEMDGRHTGLAGLEAWANAMRDDANFPREDESRLVESYIATTIFMTMLRDHCSAETFLRRAAQALPAGRGELSAAADCYHEVSHLRQGMDELIKDDFSEGTMAAVADPVVRRAFADAILQIRDKEQEAAGHIERGLGR